MADPGRGAEGSPRPQRSPRLAQIPSRGSMGSQFLTDSEQDDGSSLNVSALMNAAIDEIGAGPYQLIVLMLGGGVYMAEGAFLLMLSIVAKSLITRWELSPFAAGAMASVLFTGLLVGTITGGLACDHYGRRMPVLVTYFGISVFTIAGIASPGLALLLVAKLLLGFSLGFGVPAANAIVAESCPPAQRSNIYCMTMVLFSLGQIVSATIVWIFSPTLRHEDMEWRSMLGASTVLPMVLLVLAYIYLEESPHWLVLHGRISDARNVVTLMLEYKRRDENARRRDSLSQVAKVMEDQLRTPMASRAILDDLENDTSEEEVSADAPQATPQKPTEETPLLAQLAALKPSPRTSRRWRNEKEMDFLQQFRQCLLESRESLHALFSDSFRQTTLIMLYVTLASNFAYYGMIYGLPDTLKRAYLEDETAEAGWSPAAGLFLSAMFEIPGVFLAIMLGMTIGRRTNMTVAFFGCSLALLGTIVALSEGQITGNAGLICVLGVKLCLATAYIIVYLYLLECYPTKFRATGLAFCMVLGRLGAAACPFLYDGLALVLTTDICFFLIMAIMMAGASLACCFLPYETKDAVLEEDAPPGTCAPTNTGAIFAASKRISVDNTQPS